MPVARRGSIIILSSSPPAQTPGKVSSVGLSVSGYVGVGAGVMVGTGLAVGDAEGICVSISAVMSEQRDGISFVGPIWRLAPAINASCAGPCRATPSAAASEEISSSGS